MAALYRFLTPVSYLMYARWLTMIDCNLCFRHCGIINAHARPFTAVIIGVQS